MERKADSTQRGLQGFLSYEQATGLANARTADRAITLPFVRQDVVHILVRLLAEFLSFICTSDADRIHRSHYCSQEKASPCFELDQIIPKAEIVRMTS